MPVSGATVEGFLVKGAIGEGILVVGKPGAPVSGVTIKDNVVEGNDTGNLTGAPITKSPYRECNAVGGIPGDCGEGIHLMTVSSSVVSGNTVIDNAGGILLSDELGPTAHNRLLANTIEYNTLDCGITMPSHSTKGYVNGATVPSAAGVYDNVVEHNTIGTNNIDGDFDFSPHVDMRPTAVIVATAGSPISITVSSNSFSQNAVGVWTAGAVTVAGLAANSFLSVATHHQVG